MPRRSLHCLFLVTLFSLVCYQKAPGSRYSRVLADAMDRVCRKFYLPVNELKLFEGAMSGMIDGLGDEHSKYIKAVEKEDFEQDLNRHDTVEGDSRGADGRWNFLLPGERRIGYILISAFAEAEQGEKTPRPTFARRWNSSAKRRSAAWCSISATTAAACSRPPWRSATCWSPRVKS